MHHVTVFAPDQLAVEPAYAEHCRGYGRAAHIGPEVGALHGAMGTCELQPGGFLAPHLHSYEEFVYVIDGQLILEIDGDARRLGPGGCAFIGVGATHGWANTGSHPARWLDLQTPPARPPHLPADTFFVGGAAPEDAPPLDVRDPRARRFFQWHASQMDIDSVRRTAPVDAPVVSASMSSALLAYSGIGVKMLIDERHGAYLGNLFMVQYGPDVVLHPHDHPLEEAFYILTGEVVYIAEDREYVMGPGSVAYAGVGCIHAFVNRSGAMVRWVESRAPLPPLHNEYRFNRDWDYLAERLGAAPPS
jgi:quercetin dioxygenase-like cupin family protein